MGEVSAMQKSEEGIGAFRACQGIEMAILGRMPEIRRAPIAKRNILPSVAVKPRVGANGKRK